MSDKEIISKVVSRNEAIEKAVDFCKNNRKPNIIANTHRLCFGLAGFRMFIAEDKQGEYVYFPLEADPMSNKPVSMEGLPLTNRVDILHFFDRSADDALVDVNKDESVCYLPLPKENICGSIPFSVYKWFDSVKVLLGGLRKNNDKIFKEIMDTIVEKAWSTKNVGKSSQPPASTSPEIPKRKPVVYKFSDRGVVKVVPFSDVLDVVSFHDHYSGGNLILARDEPMRINVLISNSDNICGLISDSLVARSPALKVLIEALKGKWVIDSKEF